MIKDRSCKQCIHWKVLKGKDFCMKRTSYIPDLDMGCDEFWPERPSCETCRNGDETGELISCQHTSARVVQGEQVVQMRFQGGHRCEHWKARVSN